MGFYRSIDITLNIPFNIENLQIILQNSIDKGCIFYDQITGFRYEGSPILNSSEAAQKMLYKTPEIIDMGGPSIFTQFEDTYFHLVIDGNKHNQLTIFISTFSNQWEKQIDTTSSGEPISEFDFARYIQFLLLTFKKYTITELKTYTD